MDAKARDEIITELREILAEAEGDDPDDELAVPFGGKMYNLRQILEEMEAETELGWQLFEALQEMTAIL